MGRLTPCDILVCEFVRYSTRVLSRENLPFCTFICVIGFDFSVPLVPSGNVGFHPKFSSTPVWMDEQHRPSPGRERQNIVSSSFHSSVRYTQSTSETRLFVKLGLPCIVKYPHISGSFLGKASEQRPAHATAGRVSAYHDAGNIQKNFFFFTPPPFLVFRLDFTGLNVSVSTLNNLGLDVNSSTS